MTTPALQALAAAARDRTTRDGLELQLEQARQRLVGAEQRYDRAVAALAEELEDVARLESMSLTRIMSGLRGNRDIDLSREQAEAEAARYTAQEADGRRHAAARDVESLTARIAELGDPDARRAEAMIQREREITADPSAGAEAARVAEVSTRLGEQEAVLAEIHEALVAADRARAALEAAQRTLDEAQGWATYDTFLGGGLVGDLVKYNRIDRAAQLIRDADEALGHLGTELADVGVAAVGGVEVSKLSQTFDMWFDNLFSDWAVRDQVRRAGERVRTSLSGVHEVAMHLQARGEETSREVASLSEERERLLSGPGSGPSDRIG